MAKECEIRQSLGVPKDSKFLCNEKGEIVGILTHDGSFDYSEEGRRFMSSERDLC